MSTSMRSGLRALLGTTALAVVAGLLVAAPAQAALAGPTGLTPDDVTTTQYHGLELRWSTVSGATSYEVQVEDDGDFGNGPMIDLTTKIPAFTPPTTLPRGGYSWRVRAQDASGSGAWSAAARFMRGWTDQPVVATASGGLAPALSWAPIPDASFYEVEVSDRPFDSYPSDTGRMNHWLCYTNHTSLSPYGVAAGREDPPGDEAKCPFAYDSAGTPAADGTFPDKFFPGNFYWRVRGRDTAYDVRTSPFDAAAVSCVGVWPETGATGTPGGAVTVPLPYGPPDYLAQPECSRWSTQGAFTITAPGSYANEVTTAPTGMLVQPAAGDPAAPTVAVTDTPRFAWAPVSGAFQYRVYVSRTADFRDADHIWQTLSTNVMPVGDFGDRGLPTYWTVQACGLFRCGPVPAMKSYTKAWSRVVQNDPVAISGSMLTFSWATIYNPARPAGSVVPFNPEVKGYKIQLDELGGDFSSPLRTVDVDRAGAPAGKALWRTASSDVPGQFIWRVAGISQTGLTLPWSTAVLYDKQAPVATITTAHGFGLTSPLTITFSEPVSGVSSSTLVVRPVDVVSATPGSVVQVSATQWQFNPSGPWVAGRYYRLSVGAIQDASGNQALASPNGARASTLVDSSSPALRKVVGDSGWATGLASGTIGGSYIYSYDYASTASRSLVSATVMTTHANVYLCKGPNFGNAGIYVDGVLKSTIDLYRSYGGCGLLFSSASLPFALHTVTVSALGTRNAASVGTVVGFDAMSGS